MKRLALLLLLASALLLPTSAKAQTRTQVSATITDPDGVPWSGATVSFGLAGTGGSTQPSLTPCTTAPPCYFQIPGSVVTNANGSFSTGLWANASILPASTQWQITVTEPGVPPPWGTGPQLIMQYTVTISGGTQSLTTALTALASALTYASVTSGAVDSVTGSGGITCSPTTGAVVCSLTSNSTTVNGQTCALGSSCTVTADLPATPTQCSGSQFAQGVAANGNANCATPSGSTVTLQTNGVANASQTLLDLINSTVNAEGLTFTLTNTGTGVVKGEIGGASYSGNSATATALAATPSQCSGSQFAQGVAANGNANCATPSGGLPAEPTTPNGVPQAVTSTPSGGVGQPYVTSLPGLVTRVYTGTTDTIVSTDCNPGRVAYRGSAAVATSVPTATTLAVPNCVFKVANNTTGSATAVTFTPATWTVNGAPTLVLAQGQYAVWYVDPGGSAWDADVYDGPITAGANITVTRSQYGLTVASSASGAVGYYCTMTTTTCTVTVASLTQPGCVATDQDTAGTVVAGNCSVTGTTATVKAASSNTDTWTVIPIADGAPAATSITVAQAVPATSGSCFSTSAATITCSFSPNVPIGDSILVYGQSSFGNQPTSATDSNSDAFTCPAPLKDNYSQACYFLNVSVAISSVSMTVPTGFDTQIAALDIHKSTGSLVYDTGVQGSSTGTVFSAGPITTSGAPELLFGLTDGAAGLLTPVATGYTTQVDVGCCSSNSNIAIQTDMVATTGAYTYAGTTTNNSISSIIGGFK
jgi:hypothetical protein